MFKIEHNEPFKAVVAITGGGSRYISQVLEEGGASSWLLEAYIPYSMEAIDRYIGGTPREKYASSSTARQMAQASYERAKSFAPNEERLIGIGMACALAKDNEREGRDHHIHIAIFDGEIMSIVDWKGQLNNRQSEEILAAMYLNKAFQTYLTDGWIDKFDFNGEDNVTTKTSFKNDTLDGVHHFNKGDDLVVYSGSFNPLHAGHQYIIDKTKNFLKEPILEVSISNFDKPDLDPIEQDARYLSLLNVPNTIGVVMSNHPRFKDKTKWIKSFGVKSVTYVVGVDTYARLLPEDFEGAKFLVFPRNGKTPNDYLEIEHNGALLPESFLIEEGPCMSSRELRK